MTAITTQKSNERIMILELLLKMFKRASQKRQRNIVIDLAVGMMNTMTIGELKQWREFLEIRLDTKRKRRTVRA